MGKYDCMTSLEAPEKYLNDLRGQLLHEPVIFEDSAHYPQIEEKERFFQWMCSMFLTN